MLPEAACSESPAQPETQSTQERSFDDAPQGTQSVSDNTLGEIEVPEVMRHADEDDEHHHLNHSCTIN